MNTQEEKESIINVSNVNESDSHGTEPFNVQFLDPKWREIRKKWVKLVKVMPEGALAVFLEESIEENLKVKDNDGSNTTIE